MAEFICPPGKYCSDQQATEVGDKKTKIYHRTVTTLTGEGPAYTGAKTETYIVKPKPGGPTGTLDQYVLASTTTDGGKTQTYTSEAGEDFKKSMGPGGNIAKNTQAQVQTTLSAGKGRNALGQTGDVLEKITPEQQKKVGVISPSVASSPEAGTVESVDTGEASEGTKSTDFGNFTYPVDIGKTKQDVIKFSMLEYIPSGLKFIGKSPVSERTGTGSKIIGTVVLPIPSGISDTNACNWTDNPLNAVEAGLAAAAFAGITKGIGAGVKDLGESLKTSLGDSSTKTSIAALFAANAVGTPGGAVLSRTAGVVINPNLELLFNGPTLRPFSFTFKTSARNDKEAKQIIGILNFFKRGMSPIKTKSNLFLKTPHTFKIQYLNRSQGQDIDHPYIGKIKECALQNVTVSYTPEGQYATYVDGYMVSYEMQMQFTELEPIFNDDYGKGTGSSGPDTEIGPAN
jgi:hypothetical protein